MLKIENYNNDSDKKPYKEKNTVKEFWAEFTF